MVAHLQLSFLSWILITRCTGAVSIYWHHRSAFLNKDAGVLSSAKCFQTIKLLLGNVPKRPPRNVSWCKFTCSDLEVAGIPVTSPGQFPLNVTAGSPWKLVLQCCKLMALRMTWWGLLKGWGEPWGIASKASISTNCMGNHCNAAMVHPGAGMSWWLCWTRRTVCLLLFVTRRKLVVYCCDQWHYFGTWIIINVKKCATAIMYPLAQHGKLWVKLQNSSWLQQGSSPAGQDNFSFSDRRNDKLSYVKCMKCMKCTHSSLSFKRK